MQSSSLKSWWLKKTTTCTQNKNYKNELSATILSALPILFKTFKSYSLWFTHIYCTSTQFFHEFWGNKKSQRYYSVGIRTHDRAVSYQLDHQDCPVARGSSNPIFMVGGPFWAPHPTGGVSVLFDSILINLTWWATLLDEHPSMEHCSLHLLHVLGTLGLAILFMGRLEISPRKVNSGKEIVSVAFRGGTWAELGAPFYL